MNEEVKEVADKLSDYANTEKTKILKNIRNCSIIGTIALAVYSVLELTGLVLQNLLFEKIAGYCETVASVTVILIMLHTTGLIYKIPKKKNNDKVAGFPKVVKMIIVWTVAFVGAVIIKLLLSNFFGL